MCEIIYSQNAVNDLQDIYDYIAKVSEYNAVRYMGKLEQKILMLKELPEVGVNPRYPELLALKVKVLIFEKYLIFYRINKDKKHIEIVRVLNSKRNYINEF